MAHDSSLGPLHVRITNMFSIWIPTVFPVKFLHFAGEKKIKFKIIFSGGVIGGWDNLLCIIPGGSSTPLIPKQ